MRLSEPEARGPEEHERHGMAVAARGGGGELEARSDATNRRDGLLLPDGTLADLGKACRKMGVTASWS